jgi:hypothetical protein
MELQEANTPDLKDIPCFDDEASSPHKNASMSIKDDIESQENCEGKDCQQQMQEMEQLPVSENKTDPLETSNMLPWRFTIIFVITLGVCFYRSDATPRTDIRGFRDFVLENMESLNKMIISHPNGRIFLQVTSSALMDFAYISTFVYWMLNAKSSRLLLTLFVFYIVRAVTQLFFVMDYPQGYVWDDPGFPSIVVQYGQNGDLFYSGCSGFLMICALEWKKLGWKRMSTFIHGVNAYVSFIMLICRVHYSIDISTGIAMAHYIYLLVTQRVHSVDKLLSELFNRASKYVETKRSKNKMFALQNDRVVYEPRKKTGLKSYEVDF